MSISKSEADVILNRTNVALARSQRLVASWLPPPKSTTGTTTNEEELANTKSEEELQKEEDNIFTPVPERLGLGAPLPQKEADGSWNRNELDSNAKLRKQLLGRNYQKVMKKTAAAANQTNKRQDVSKTGGDSTTASSTQQQAGNEEGNKEEEGDEEGRTSVIGKKRKKAGGDGPRDNGDDNNGQSDETGIHHVEAPVSEGGIGEQSAKRGPSMSKGRKKATSFLDEILAERSKKRKKK